MTERKEAWFKTWFDSSYYYKLYRHRNINEAGPFLKNLVSFLDIRPDQLILDLACGRGRHSILLNQMGMHVIGIDLSERNIDYARQFENDRLHFYEHDMRNEFKMGPFDFVLNFFTSFGYFDTQEENEKVVRNVSDSLKDNGKFLLDFLNPYTVLHHLENEDLKTIDNIEFRLNKKLRDDGYIIKQIDIDDQGKTYHFREKVKAIRRSEFMTYFNKAELELLHIFGDYELNPYVPDKSERMIFLLKK